MRIIFLNTTILTSDGTFTLKTMPLEQLKSFLAQHPDAVRLSAVGHESAAQAMTELLGEEVVVNRIQYTQVLEDVAVCFKLKGRPPEGAVLSRGQLEEFGYEFKVLCKFCD